MPPWYKIFLPLIFPPPPHQLKPCRRTPSLRPPLSASLYLASISTSGSPAPNSLTQVLITLVWKPASEDSSPPDRGASADLLVGNRCQTRLLFNPPQLLLFFLSISLSLALTEAKPPHRKPPTVHRNSPFFFCLAVTLNPI